MRKKTIFTNEEIITKFLNKEDGYYRNKQDNLYCKNNTLYSYGAHHIMAKWTLNKNGQQVLLVNTLKSTRTTENQKHLLFSYISNMKINESNVVLYYDMGWSDRSTVEDMIEKIHRGINEYKHCKPNNREKLKQSIKGKVKTLIFYAEMFGLEELYISHEQKYIKLSEILDKLRIIEKYDIEMYMLENTISV